MGADAAHLRPEGVLIGRRRAARLMRLMGLLAIYPAQPTSNPHPEHGVYPFLLRGLAIERPNQVWCAHISTGSCPGTWCKSVALYAAPGG